MKRLFKSLLKLFSAGPQGLGDQHKNGYSPIANNYGTFRSDEDTSPPYRDLNEVTANAVATIPEDYGDPLANSGTEVYGRRFYILALFFYVACTTILIWGTFGPITASAKFSLGWSEGYIALLDGWGPIFSILCMVPFSWATQRFGLRVGMLLATSLVTLGAGVRCISMDDPVFTYLASVGAILDGMASCLTLSLPAMLSSTWFPITERATATAVGAVATQLAAAGMYLAPLIVREPQEGLTKEDIKADIQVLMYIHAGMAAFGFLCALVYFPEKPPKPPSFSSYVERANYFESLKMLLKNPHVMLVILTYVASMAIPLSWTTIMNFSLECLGITQDQSMWIALTACLVSPAAAFLVARVTDCVHGHLKITIIGLMLCASGFFLWFLLMTEKIIAASFAYVFIGVVFAISLQYSTVPLLIELAVEIAYPCPESVVGALLTFLMDIVDTMFFLVLMIPSKCFRWVSFALVGTATLTIVPMLYVKQVLHRSNFDHSSELGRSIGAGGA